MRDLRSPDRPLSIIKRTINDVFGHMSVHFDRMYSKVGRASVPSVGFAADLTAIHP